MSFTYFAQCLENCAAIGLSDGDKLGIEARFGFTDHSVTPNAVLRTSDVLSFSGRFGDLISTSTTWRFSSASWTT